MRISFCTIAFQKNKWGKERSVEVPITEIAPLVAAGGYDGIEVWEPHVHDLAEAEVLALRGQLDALGLKVAMLSPYFNFTKSEEHACESLALGMHALANARRLGARGIRCFTGNHGSADATEEQWTRAIESLRTLADAGPDLLWALETHPWNLMDTIEGSLRLVQSVDRPNVRLIFQPSTFGENYLTALEALAPYSVHVHATNSTPDKRFSLAEGAMDYPTILTGLRARGFDGFISVEYMGDDPRGVLLTEAAYLRGLLGA